MKIQPIAPPYALTRAAVTAWALNLGYAVVDTSPTSRRMRYAVYRVTGDYRVPLVSADTLARLVEKLTRWVERRRQLEAPTP